MAQSVFDGLSLTALDGSPVDPATLKGKVVLVVNVASKCGFTHQYEGLEKLYSARKADGLVVLGVPCNQFGGQEPGSAEEIATFCRTTYGVDFPMLEKQDVNGGSRSELYTRLVGSEAGASKDIGWNFEKFLVGRDGAVVGRYGSSVAPGSDALTTAITTALAAK